MNSKIDYIDKYASDLAFVIAIGGRLIILLIIYAAMIILDFNNSLSNTIIIGQLVLEDWLNATLLDWLVRLGWAAIELFFWWLLIKSFVRIINYLTTDSTPDEFITI